ncbi:hypothetical protein BJI67_00450 [Acidihalobacter aeolianus]|uniref:N-acetyltransferase domain-containing protein n=1 Tax=Acidihalobacter aeolianus TaxID=2792603 RepID=A0A1D8K448_9GAMM|nr:GNAT family N-acetyltransferase [Acidihalobacter aeolianus]AOV15730.1 hypothetical protein BJI67_00450 [Acidihalobacter aeolianus]
MSPLPTLETPRLRLRPFAATDAPDVQRLAGDFAIADTTAHIPHPYEDGVAESWIATRAEAFAQGTGLSLAIAARSGGDLIGAISLMQIAPGHQAELGYWIGRPYWGNGYCTEAGEAMLRHVFGELGLIRVHALHLSRNPASGRVMQKLGMRHEGHRRQHHLRHGRPEDIELYCILKQEWAERARAADPQGEM